MLRLRPLRLVVVALSFPAACADDRPSLVRHGDAGVSLGRPDWVSETLTRPPEGAERAGAAAVSNNAALRPETPWVGTLGLRAVPRNGTDYGVGFAVPNTGAVAGRAGSAVRHQGLGVGAWYAFDF